MTLFLLILAALIVVLQIALTLTLRRVLDLLAQSGNQIDALQQRVAALEGEHASAAPSGLFTLPARIEPAGNDIEPEASVTAPDAEHAGAAGPVDLADLPVLQEATSVAESADIGSRVRELARQGLPVREIAERCGLSEAEAELFIRLRQEPQ